MTREDFIFTIGYDGPAAVVDIRAKRLYGALPAGELAKKGLYRAAYAAALWSGRREDMRQVLDIYNRLSGCDFTPETPPSRHFGVFRFDDVKRVVYL